MPTELPYAADAEESLSYQELDVLKRQFDTESRSSHVSIQTKFNYAWGLVKSREKTLQTEGVKLLQGESQGRRWETYAYGVSASLDVRAGACAVSCVAIPSRSRLGMSCFCPDHGFSPVW